MSSKDVPNAAAANTKAAAQSSQHEEEEAAAAAVSAGPHCAAQLAVSEPVTPTTPGGQSPVAPVTSQLSSNLRQRLSRGITQRSARTDDEDEEGSGEVAPGSATSSTTATQWHRHNPYATSPAQSQPAEDCATPQSSHFRSASGVLRSPPQVTVHMHTSSNRVSRTTSMVKTADTSLVYSPQMAHNQSSLPGSTRVSRQTSMMKGNESIGFATPQLRFAPSQSCSAAVSRTTSMVTGGPHNSTIGYNYMEDSIPILSQPSMQPHPQQQQQVSVVSPLLRMSPHTSQPNLFAPSSFSTEDRHSSPMQYRTHSGMMQQQQDGSSGDSGVPYTPGNLLHFRATPEGGDDAAPIVSIRTSLTHSVGGSQPAAAHSVSRQHLQQPERQRAAPRSQDDLEVTRGGMQGYTSSLAHSSPYTPQAGQGNFDFHHQTSPPSSSIDSGEADALQASPTAAYVPPEDSEGEEGGGEEEDGPQINLDHLPNELGSTQPPRPPQERAATPSNASAAAAGAESSFTVAEMTSALEAARARTKAEAAAAGEVWCPAGSLFSVYDAGMKEHYNIPSEKVALTRGAIKYVSLFERYGNQTRFRFQLCNRYLHNRCSCGTECQYIHSQVVSGSTQVHMNENSITASGVRQMKQEELAGGRNTMNYPTVPSGMIFAVFPPNQLNSSPQLIPSELILITEGALQTQRALAALAEDARSSAAGSQVHGGGSGGAEVPIVRPRHCAHFQFKRMCNLGASCHFIHSLIPFVQGMVNQPPLPFTIQPSVLDERSAGFVIPKRVSGDAQSSDGGAPTGSGGILSPLQGTLTQQTWPQQLPSAYMPEASLLPMGDAPASMNSMYAAPYAQGKLPLPNGASMAGASGAGVAYTQWGGGFPQNFTPYGVSSVGAVPTYGLPSTFAPPQQPQAPQMFMTDAVGGFRPMMQQQSYGAYANSAIAPQPWPPAAAPYF